jgi:hypothetical protein
MASWKWRETLTVGYGVQVLMRVVRTERAVLVYAAPAAVASACAVRRVKLNVVPAPGLLVTSIF